MNYSLIVILLTIFIILNYFLIDSKNYNISANPNVNNVNLHNTLKNKNKNENTKVIIFISINYPQKPIFGKYFENVLLQYCKYHNYDFRLYDHSDKITNMSPYWLRVEDLYNLLFNTPENSIIVYIDYDAFINPKKYKIPIEQYINAIDKLTNKKWDMYIPTDPFIHTKEMNTGVIIARNTDWTKKFVQTWFNNYPKKSWKFINNKWECNKCIWAGDEYEQGSINRMYSNNILESKNHIIPIKYSVLSHMDYNSDSYWIHLMRYTDNQRLSIIKDIYYNSVKNN